MNKKDNSRETKNIKTKSTGDSMNSAAQAKSKKGPIRKKIEALSEKIKSEGRDGPTGKAVRDKAVALILKSANSKEWKNYMNLFGFSESELQTLVPGGGERKDEALAYLVGNGPCGGSSIDIPVSTECGLIFGVTDDLDKSSPKKAS